MTLSNKLGNTTMKTLLITTALLISATTASAFTCKNTVTADAHGVITYTASQCGNQAPASADTLAMITYIANNPPKDNVVDDVPLTKLEKLTLRNNNLELKNKAKMDTIIKLATRFDGSDPARAAKMLNESIYHRSIGKGKYADKQLALSQTLSNFGNWSDKAKAKGASVADKMVNIRDKKNKVEARIAKLSDTPK